MKTAEQIAARKAKSAARRAAKHSPIPVKEETTAKLKKIFKGWMDAYLEGKLTVNNVRLTFSSKAKKSYTAEELEAKIKKEQRKLEALNKLLGK
jgi:hypothetical protein